MCIEFDGIQHFKEISRFGGYQKFLDTKKRDDIKNKYCKSKNIILIRIRYDEILDINDIYDILDEALGINSEI